MQERQQQPQISDDVPDAAMDESPDAVPLNSIPDAAPLAATTPSASAPQTSPSISSPNGLTPGSKGLMERLGDFGDALKQVVNRRKRVHSDAFSRQSQTSLSARSATSVDSAETHEQLGSKKHRTTETPAAQAAKTDSELKDTDAQILASLSSSSQATPSSSHTPSPATTGTGSAAVELKPDKKAPQGLAKRSGKNTEIFDRVIVINLSPSWQTDLERDLKEITVRCNLLLKINRGSQSSTANVELKSVLEKGDQSALYKTISTALGSIFDFSSSSPATRSPVKALYLNNFSEKELKCLPDVIHDLAEISFFQNPYFIDFTGDDTYKLALKKEIVKKCKFDMRECVLKSSRQDFIKMKFDRHVPQNGMGLAPMDSTILDSDVILASSSSLHVRVPQPSSTSASERKGLSPSIFAHNLLMFSQAGSQAGAATEKTEAKDKTKDKEKIEGTARRSRRAAKQSYYDSDNEESKEWHQSTTEQLKSLARDSIKWLTLIPKTETSAELGAYIFVYDQRKKTKLTNITTWILKHFVKSADKSDKKNKQDIIQGVGFSFATPYKKNKNLKIACLQSTDEDGRPVGYCDEILGPIWKQIISNMTDDKAKDEFKKQKLDPKDKDWKIFRKIFLEKNVQHHLRLGQSLKSKGYSRHEKDKWEFLGVTAEGKIQIRDKDGKETFLPDRIAMLSATEILKYKPSHAASSSSDSERKSQRSLRDSDAPASSAYGSGSGSGFDSSFASSSSRFFGSSSSQPVQQLSMPREKEESARRKP